MNERPRTDLVDRPKRPTLWDLEADRREILAVIEDSGGEITAEQERALARLDAALLQKADGFCWVVKKLEAEADLYDERAKVIAARGQARKNMAMRLKGMMRDFMQQRGMRQVKGDDFTVSLQESTGVVVEGRVQDLPERFVTRPEPVPNKIEIGKAIKAGEDVAGARLERRPFVVIR